MIIFLRDDMMADSDLEDKYSKYNFGMYYEPSGVLGKATRCDM